MLTECKAEMYFSVVSVQPAGEEKENSMFKKFEMELAGRTLRVDVGRVAAQANGAALMHYGETVVLSTATASENRERASISSRSPLNMKRNYMR